MCVTGPHTPSFSEELQQARLLNARGSWAVCDVFARNPNSWGGQGLMTLQENAILANIFVQAPTLNFSLSLFTSGFQMECRKNLGFLHYILKIEISKFNLWVLWLIFAFVELRFCLEDNFPVVTKAVEVPRGKNFPRCSSRNTTWNVLNVVVKGFYSNVMFVSYCWLLAFYICEVSWIVQRTIFCLLLLYQRTFLLASKCCRFVSIKVKFILCVRLCNWQSKLKTWWISARPLIGRP